MEKIAVLVSDLKSEYSEIEYNKIMFEQYGIACFDKKSNANILYLEILLLDNIDFLCLDIIKLNNIVLRNYKNIYSLDDTYLDIIPEMKINNNIIEIIDDQWDSVNW